MNDLCPQRHARVNFLRSLFLCAAQVYKGLNIESGEVVAVKQVQLNVINAEQLDSMIVIFDFAFDFSARSLSNFQVLWVR
jgi:hypothetical protein